MAIAAAIFHRSQHLTEADLVPLGGAKGACAEMDGSVCPFCGGAERSPVFELQQNPRIDLMECAQCCAVSASRLPTDAALEAYYKSYYASESSPATDSKVTFDDPIRLARHISKRLPHPFPDEMTVLDFGGGDGTIAYLAARELVYGGCSKASVTVIDPSAYLTPSDDPRITVQKMPDLSATEPGSFSLVIASAIIEHYPNPSQLMRDLLARVRAGGGCFYARTPYMAPLIRLLKLVGVRLDFTYPGHLHDLGQEFWERYFQRAESDFVILDSRPSIVETTLSRHFVRTLTAHMVKLPWYVFRSRYSLVGGWEIFAMKR